MGNDWVNRTTRQHLSGQSPVSMADLFGGSFVDGSGNAVSNIDWIWNPDFSAVTGFSSKYWIIVGDVITLMDQAARDAVDAQRTADAMTADRESNKDRFNAEKVLKALALVMIDEINLLRAELGLSARTPSQAIKAVENKIESLS